MGEEDALVGAGLDAGVNTEDDPQIDRGAGVADTPALIAALNQKARRAA